MRPFVRVPPVRPVPGPVAGQQDRRRRRWSVGGRLAVAENGPGARNERRLDLAAPSEPNSGKGALVDSMSPALWIVTGRTPEREVGR